jgi:outer membrane protein TolC
MPRVLVLLPALICPLISACIPALIGSEEPHGRMTQILNGLTGTGKAAKRAITPEDPIAHTRLRAAKALAEHRIRPVSTYAGKKALTLDECKELALMNSLEKLSAQFRVDAKEHLTYAKMAKMWPHITFSGELSERNNYRYSYSDVLGIEGLAPSGLNAGETGVTTYSASHERSTWKYIIEGQWSPIDAALAYYLAKNGVNDVTKARLLKVRIGQKLIGTVEGAFFRLLALQEAQPKARRLARVCSEIFHRTKSLYQDRLIDSDRYYKAEDRLTNARRLLSKIGNETEIQRNILASALGVTPDRCVDGGFYLVGSMGAPCSDLLMCDLETQAIRNRPEAYEAGLNHLNSMNDVKRTIIKYFPNVTGFWRYTRDKDRFLRDKEWNEVGMLIHVDLLDWVSNYYESQGAKATEREAGAEVGSVALGIVSQVRVEALRYLDAHDDYRNICRSLSTSRSMFAEARERVKIDDLDKLAMDEIEAETIKKSIERVRALGELNAKLAKLNSVTGVNYGENILRR